MSYDRLRGLGDRYGVTPTGVSAMLEQSSYEAPTTPLPAIDLIQPPSAAAALAPRYRVEKELGRGGMGVVYLARDTRVDRVVAIKVLLGGGFAGEVPRQRLLSEATTVARLDHPNIVRLYEVGEFEGVPYLVLEYVSGETLRQRILQQLFTPTQAAEVVATLARAVEHAHANGVIHRDLKPQNVLLVSGPGDVLVPKLTDFGIAKRLGEGSELTGTGVLLGTPAYMAPEQAASRREAISPRTDVYSLGAILYELLTSRPPYPDDDPPQVALRVLLETPTPPRSVRPTTPPGLEAICLKCMEKSPERRYSTALELAEDLDRWLRGEVPSARPPSRFKRIADRVTTRRFLSTFAVLMLVVTTVVLGVLLALPRATHPPDPREEFERRLAAGEAVTLIGETGLPAWHRWAIGPAPLTTTGTFLDGTASFNADTYSMLELVSDPMTDRYRLTAEVRDDTPTDVAAEADSLRVVGLYAAHRLAHLPDVGEVHRFMGINFADRMLPSDLIPNQPHKHRAQLQLITVGRETNNASAREGFHTFGSVRFDPAINTPPHNANLVPPRAWRTVTIEVTPEGFDAYWGKKSEGTAFGHCAATELDHWYRQWPPFTISVPDGTPTPDVLGWVPRSPLGVYARGTAVSVRNVVVEPLPDH